jgi:hypothetical protein
VGAPPASVGVPPTAYKEWKFYFAIYFIRDKLLLAGAPTIAWDIIDICDLISCLLENQPHRHEAQNYLRNWDYHHLIL